MPLDRSLLALDVVAGCVALFVFKHFLASVRRPPLPPGPKGLPLVGNVLDLPGSDDKPWLHWQKHKRLYGPISSVTALGQTVVILNDYDLAVDVLERRSGEFSDRPVFPFGGKMVGWEASFPMSQYGERLKGYRKRFYHFLGTKTAVSGFAPLLELETKRFLLRTMLNPPSLQSQIRRLAGAIILMLTHGYAIEPEGTDPLVTLADDVMSEFMLSTTPSLWIVDVMPFLKFLPSWFPGAGFKRVATEWRRHAREFIEKPFAFVQQQIAMDNGRPGCFVASQLSEAKTERDAHAIKWCAAAMYGGGADTTVSALYTFFLAMTLFPDVMRRAQQEIDAVVGCDRLPAFQDRGSLPYVEAVMLESLRWHVVGPLALPHAAQEDCVVRGYFIPKGAIVLANCWEFAHNHDTYSEPMEFIPERFIKTDRHEPEMDPRSYVFGFGRRICPGKDLAEAALWLQTAMSLAAFDIRKARDESGNEIVPACKYTNSLLTHPEEFPCELRPRSMKAASLVGTAEDEYPQGESDMKALESVEWDEEGQAVFEPW